MLQQITKPWADGDYTFLLKRKGWIELEHKHDKGPLELLDLFLAHRWRIEWLSDIVRLGLIGGGTSPENALRLVRSYVDERPMMESVALCIEILQAGLFYRSDESETPSGEPQAETETGASIPPETTAPQPS